MWPLMMSMMVRTKLDGGLRGNRPFCFQSIYYAWLYGGNGREFSSGHAGLI